MKILYRVYSGDVNSRTALTFKYNFSNTKDITLKVSECGYCVEVYRTVVKEADQLLQDMLFKDALRKVARIQLIKYGEIFKGSVYAEIKGKKSCIYNADAEGQNELIYSMCGDKLKRRFADNWGIDSLQRVISVTKTKAGRVDAALDAALMAKSKIYETERFIYLYIDENLYKWFSKECYDGEIYPRITEIARNCKCDKNKRLVSCVIDGGDIA